MSDAHQAPRRLLELGGAAGDCLRRALAQSEQVGCLPRFAELQELRLRRARRQRGLVLLLLGAVAVFCLRSLRRAEPLPNIQAELLSLRSQPPAALGSAYSPQPLSVQAPPDRVLSELPGTTTAPLKPSAPRPGGKARAVERARRGSEAEAASEPGAGGGAKACAELARSGGARAALDCYAKLGAGAGMTAELALFEQARLEGKVLRRPERALRVLDDYRRRFPHGSLRAEVMLAQIDWLLGSGDSARALQVVSEALGSGLLRERTAELERLQRTLAATPAGGASR